MNSCFPKQSINMFTYFFPGTVSCLFNKHLKLPSTMNLNRSHTPGGTWKIWGLFRILGNPFSSLVIASDKQEDSCLILPHTDKIPRCWISPTVPLKSSIPQMKSQTGMPYPHSAPKKHTEQEELTSKASLYTIWHLFPPMENQLVQGVIFSRQRTKRKRVKSPRAVNFEL